MGILKVAALEVQYMYQTTKGKNTGLLFFGQDMIPPINHLSDWRYIRQCKQAQIEKDVTIENTTITHYNYRVVDLVMIRNKSENKYETPFKGLCEIVQAWTNITVTLQAGAVMTRINIHGIKKNYF